MDTFKKPEEPEKNKQAENDEDGNLMKGKRAKISTPGRLKKKLITFSKSV